jgi:hypothetical protein
MNKALLTIAAVSMFAMSACGRAPTLEIDAELLPYVIEFEQHGGEVGAPVKVQDLIAGFGNLDNPRSNGVCELQQGETPKIIISRTKWDRMTEEKRESLMFHELGHCILGRKHDSSTTQDGIPASLMNPYSLDSWTYAEYRAYYINELFGAH